MYIISSMDDNLKQLLQMNLRLPTGGRDPGPADSQRRGAHPVWGLGV